MTRTIIKLGVAASVPLLLTACGGHKNSASTTTPVTTTPQRFQDKAGTAFAAIFSADPNSTPKDPVASDLPALDLSAVPFTR